MIAFLTICYGLIYFLLFEKLKLLTKNARNISIFVGIGVVLIGSIVILWLTFAPTSKDARMFQYVIPIVPNVKGQVVEVPVNALAPLKKGDVLFRIDPTPFEYNVANLKASLQQEKAQKALAEVEVKRGIKLVKTQAGPQEHLDQWQAKLDVSVAKIVGLEAQLNNAQWQLAETVVKAPADGHVVNLQLRPGNMVSNLPVSASMAFVSNEEKFIFSSFSQSAIRYIQVGDEAEIIFTGRPGQVYSGKVTHIIEDTGEAQNTVSGVIPTLTGTPINGRRAVRVVLDDEAITSAIEQGAGGTLAVYTSKGKPIHIISKIVLRMQSLMAYLTSP